MASTEELEAQILAEMEANPEAYAAEESNVLVIDNDLRTITIPGTIKNLGVESDDDVHRLYFQMPKTYGEFDLSEFDIRINYRNGNIGDVYAVEDKNAEGDVITFSWLVGRNAVRTKGATQFIVCLKKSDSSGVVKQEFNTTVASLNVLEGLETTEQVVQANADIIEQILKKIDGLTSISPEDIANAVAEYMSANPIDVPENLSDLNEDTTHRTVTDEEKSKWDKAEENVQPDWNETDSTKDSYIQNKPSIPSKTSDLQNDSNFISSPATAEVGQVIAVESVDDTGKPTAWKAVTLEDGIANVEMTADDTDVILEPMPKAYIFPEMVSLTISLTEGKEKEMYHFSVTSGATALTLTLNGITVATDSASVEASKTYEVDIWNQIAIVREVA